MIIKFLNHNNKLYKVKREINMSSFKNKEEELDLGFVKEFRDYLVCDHVLQNGSHFIFCNEVTDVDGEEVVEEIIGEDI